MKARLKSLLGARGRVLVKALWIDVLWASGMLKHARRHIARSGGIVVLTFHRVMPEAGRRATCSPQGMLVTDKTFGALVRYVSKRCRAISLAGAPRWTGEDARPFIALTFDDGWIDNFEHAEPLARRYNVPIAIFVCPSKVGLPLPYWPERVNALAVKLRPNRSAARRADHILEIWSGTRLCSMMPSIASTQGTEYLIALLKKESRVERERLLEQIAAIANKVQAANNEPLDATMTWEQIRSLNAAGVVFGSHTNSHEILPCISLSESQEELAQAKTEIEDRLGRPCPLFAYPNGDWSPEVRDLVGHAGHQFAFINDAGIWNRETDPLLIPRTNIWEANLIGRSGKFSSRAFEYAAFWRPYRAHKRRAREIRETRHCGNASPARNAGTI